MNTLTPAIQKLSRRLIALESARDPSDARVNPAARACEKVQVPLTKLAGTDGFRSLMTRAMTLAKAEVPWLASVQVRTDGSLEGFDAARGQLGAVQCDEAGAVVVAQLLGLLVTFIGEPVTLRLVRDAWPDVSVTEMNAGSGEGS
jgi:hypothetical protein